MDPLTAPRNGTRPTDPGRADPAANATSLPANPLPGTSLPGTSLSGTAPSGTSPGNTLPAISLPTGGGAIRGIGERFATNPVTGTGSMSVPIATSRGRSGF